MQKSLADADEVRRSIGKKNVVIVDARSREEYNGSEVRGARRGHIPSAVNIDWTRNIGNDSFKSKAQIGKNLFKYSKECPDNHLLPGRIQGG